MPELNWNKIAVIAFFVGYFPLVWSNGTPFGVLRLLGPFSRILWWLRLDQEWRNFSHPPTCYQNVVAVMEFTNRESIKIECFESAVKNRWIRSISSHKLRRFRQRFVTLPNPSWVVTSYRDYFIRQLSQEQREALRAFRFELQTFTPPPPATPLEPHKMATTVFRSWDMAQKKIGISA